MEALISENGLEFSPRAEDGLELAVPRAKAVASAFTEDTKNTNSKGFEIFCLKSSEKKALVSPGDLFIFQLPATRKLIWPLSLLKLQGLVVFDLG